MQLTLSHAVKHADIVVIDGHSFEHEFREIRSDGPHPDGELFRFGRDIITFDVRDQVLEPCGPHEFSVVDADGNELVVEFHEVQRVPLNFVKLLARY